MFWVHAGDGLSTFAEYFAQYLHRIFCKTKKQVTAFNLVFMYFAFLFVCVRILGFPPPRALLPTLVVTRLDTRSQQTCNALHRIAQNFTAQNSTTQNCTAKNFTAQISLHRIALHRIAQISLHRVAGNCTLFHRIA